MTTTRRTFVIQSVVGAGAFATACMAQAQGAMVTDKDPQAAALGYVADATKADTKKYPKFAKGQACSSCALFQGKAGDKAGGCPLFAGKQVASAGWCSAYAKKA